MSVWSLDSRFGGAISDVCFQSQLMKKLLRDSALAPMSEEYSRDATALVSVILGMEDGKRKDDLILTWTRFWKAT